MPPRRHARWLLLALGTIQFTHLLDFVIMMPLGPQLVQAFHISDAQFGLLVSAYTFAAGSSGLLAASYIDRFARKRLLLVLYTLFALSTLACGLAQSYQALMLARVSAGLFGGVLSAQIQTIVADLVPAAQRGRALGVVMTAYPLSTVLGVPLALYLTAHGSWQVPFLAIVGVCAVLAPLVALYLPRLDGHLAPNRGLSVWHGMHHVLRDPRHWLAFGLTALLMFTGSSIVPYVTLYLYSTVGVAQMDIPIVYFCGGLAALAAGRVVGPLTDRFGPLRVFRGMALILIVPMWILTTLSAVPLWAVCGVMACFMACMSGRMIPAMALVTSAANPRWRGTFMTLNASVQQAALGAAALVGGHIIGRNAQGQVQNYANCAALGMAASLVAVYVAGRLAAHQSPAAS